MCDWVTLLYSSKLAEHCKPVIMEKNKNEIKKKEENTRWRRFQRGNQQIKTNYCKISKNISMIREIRTLSGA